MENNRNYLEECDFIGEIGMDSVWCQVPLEIQQQVLEQQLQIAADQKKPVLLHTKGQEKKICQMIQDFPGKICVHWYSGEERELEGYLEKDCYFTLGPDQSPLILENVPIQRLFLETDGLSAVEWAKGEKGLPMRILGSVLQENLECAAIQNAMKAEEVLLQMQKNLEEFLTDSCVNREGMVE